MLFNCGEILGAWKKQSGIWNSVECLTSYNRICQCKNVSQIDRVDCKSIDWKSITPWFFSPLSSTSLKAFSNVFSVDHWRPWNSQFTASCTWKSFLPAPSAPPASERSFLSSLLSGQLVGVGGGGGGTQGWTVQRLLPLVSQASQPLYSTRWNPIELFLSLAGTGHCNTTWGGRAASWQRARNAPIKSGSLFRWKLI